MAATIKYFIVDVFAKEKYRGNQLAVFLDLEKTLSSEQMLAITREINLAETSFIRSLENDNSFEVRIFTPEHEVPFAGHPSLGSAYIIAKQSMTTIEDKLVLRLKGGDISIHISAPKKLEASRFTMQQVQPKFGPSFSAKEIAKGLGIPVDAIDTMMPIEEISTGLPYLIIFLRDMDTMQQLQNNEQKTVEFLSANHMHKSNSSTGLTTSLFFVTNGTVDEKNDYHGRMFALENDKILEDAATGSANGCFLAYLLKHLGTPQSVVVEQGVEMGRKSILYLDGALKNNEYIIKVGGQVVPIAEGVWLV